MNSKAVLSYKITLNMRYIPVTEWSLYFGLVSFNTLVDLFSLFSDARGTGSDSSVNILNFVEITDYMYIFC